MTPEQLTQLIRDKLHIKHLDCLPFTGWDRSVDRNGLAEIMGQAGFKVGAEIGVRKGHYSKVLCEKIKGLKIYCVDPWASYRNRRPTQEQADAIFETAKSYLKDYDAVFVRKTSLAAVDDFEDGSLDFVYIDGMHEFDYVMTDIICWTPKVRIGGIVAGHDYVDGFACGVVNAVRAYTYAHHITEWYLTYDVKGEEMPVNSWFWVRQASHGYLPQKGNWR